jgi:leucyl aminopeptidase (aminopeptidase T)
VGLPDIFRGAGRLINECAAIQSGERVLVVTDTVCQTIGEAVASVALTVTNDVTLMVMPVYGRLHGQDPSACVAAAMRNSDIVFLPTVWSMSHSKARRDASNAGVRCIAIPSADEELFARTIPEAPFAEMKPVVMEVNRLLSEANEARVVTPGGTDIWVDLRGRRNLDLEHGWLHKGLPEYASNWTATPCIEANIAPIEGTAKGRVVVDAAQSAVGLVKEPIVLTIEGGRISKIEGGDEAQRLRLRLMEVGDPDIFMVAELGIGLNPKARMRGQFIEDESVYGTGHIGIGNNQSSMGGRISVNGHFDNIFWRPTVYLDGQAIMVDGRLAIPGFESIKGIYV